MVSIVRLLAVFAAATVALLAAACDEGRVSRFGDLEVVGSLRPVWRYKQTPPARGPARIVRNVVLLSARHGFLATAAQPGNGLQRKGLGRIQESRDGGLTWRTVWSQGQPA